MKAYWSNDIKRVRTINAIERRLRKARQEVFTDPEQAKVITWCKRLLESTNYERHHDVIEPRMRNYMM